jgi:hypothetical protein
MLITMEYCIKYHGNLTLEEVGTVVNYHGIFIQAKNTTVF